MGRAMSDNASLDRRYYHLRTDENNTYWSRRVRRNWCPLPRPPENRGM